MIIHVCGQMGAGKTTLSRVLSQRLGWPILNRDATERRLAWALVRRGWDLDDLDWRDPAETQMREVPWAIYRDHLHRATVHGRRLLAESTGYNLREAWAWRGVPDDKVLRVWLHAPLDVVQERIRVRATRPEYQARRPPQLEWTDGQFLDALRAIDRRATEEGAPRLPGRATLTIDTAVNDAAAVLAVATGWLAEQGVSVPQPSPQRQHPPFHRVVAVEPRPPYSLHLIFEDGAHRIVDLGEDILAATGPMVVPLREWDYFKRVRVDDEGVTITWPNGWDADPAVLYAGGAPCKEHPGS